MKKFIRFLFKIPATPFVLVFCVIGYIIFSIFAFLQWVYESSKFNRDVTEDCRNDMLNNLKVWFTTI